MASNVGISRTKENEDQVKRDRARRKAEQTAAGMGGAGLSGGTGATSMSTGSQESFGSTTPGIGPAGGWWGGGGGLNQQGYQTSAEDPVAFWANYGGPANKGWDPYGNTQGFFESTFNPQGLANMAFPGGGFKSYESKMAGANNIANTISGGNAMNVDPGTLVGNVMQALAAGDMQNLARLSPSLAGILSSGQISAGGTIQALMSFLSDSLRGAIPEDALNQMMTMLQNAGREYFQSTSRAGNQNMGSPESAIKFIMQRLGPTLGF